MDTCAMSQPLKLAHVVLLFALGSDVESGRVRRAVAIISSPGPIYYPSRRSAHIRNACTMRASRANRERNEMIEHEAALLGPDTQITRPAA
jgi:hypothetical protein